MCLSSLFWWDSVSSGCWKYQDLKYQHHVFLWSLLLKFHIRFKKLFSIAYTNHLWPLYFTTNFKVYYIFEKISMLMLFTGMMWMLYTSGRSPQRQKVLYKNVCKILQANDFLKLPFKYFYLKKNLQCIFYKEAFLLFPSTLASFICYFLYSFSVIKMTSNRMTSSDKW